MIKHKRLGLLIGLAVAAFIFVFGGAIVPAHAAKTVTIGINGSDHRQWNPAEKTLAKEGIKLKFVTFSDYNQPNTALVNGDVDLNAFQTKYFFDDWKKTHKAKLSAIGKTVIAPLALYSSKHTKVSQIKKGDTIIIANDVTDEGRALTLLQNAGLIKIKNKTLPTVHDITQNKLNLKIKEVDASQTAHSLGDVSAAVINSGVATDAKLNHKEALYTEQINKQSKPYINIIAARTEDKNNKTYKKVVQAFQQEATKKAIQKIFKGAETAAWDIKLK
ncbi:MetQ/NlpA family ABC transporter substrate-binding protein [Loigolactobacillus coryniformis]|uniref:MetQ/NlpA family ABC transporter substrate-binding protein n=1 Tax=Loigolactobacillus coryniformis TaxID=1610 RepID=UPI001C5CD9C7|nr:MetQ/NlpA family ABC transporter substrate-binding protein [Loigolactobacillus coryniformis]MBW4801561.1 MetQ/NlpA family ABC transporter substrate-binding protein [Loigolactobacillus coryniformis subsp. torquens]MBW4804262.1 MetQ/NlpA family ABC transporter substrate-binding protein [Loigolactobacillus coryniformis subsp. torquens]